jgi:hypothetical protein
MVEAGPRILRGDPTPRPTFDLAAYSSFDDIVWPTEGILGPRLVLDIGVGYGSGLLAVLTEDPRLILLGIEGQPANFETCFRNMFGSSEAALLPNIESARRRVVLRQSLVAPTTGTVDFHKNHSPLLGSVLPTAAGGAWFTETTGTVRLPATTLAVVLAAVPADVELHYLNINAAAAGHLLLASGGTSVARFNMISVDCTRSDIGRMEWSSGRVGGCEREALDFRMKHLLGFTFHYCGLSHCHYARSQEHLSSLTFLFRRREWETVTDLAKEQPTARELPQ